MKKNCDGRKYFIVLNIFNTAKKTLLTNTRRTQKEEKIKDGVFLYF